MDLWPSAIVALFLLAAAVGLLVSHVRTWRLAQAAEPNAKELDFHRRQFRRRVQTSTMLGLLAVAIFLGQVLTPWLESRVFTVVFWSGVLLVVLWMSLLAVADIVATRFHYGRLQHDCLVEQVRLRGELDRIRHQQGNGKAE